VVVELGQGVPVTIQNVATGIRKVVVVVAEEEEKEEEKEEEVLP